MQEFSLKRWCGLTTEQKQSHRIKDCFGCQNDINYLLSQFPNRCKSYQSVVSKKDLPKTKKLILNDIRKVLIKKVDKIYTNTIQTTMRNTFTNPALNKKSAEEMHKQKKHIIKETVKYIENQLKETSVIRYK